jgi:hypothetical protein
VRRRHGCDHDHCQRYRESGLSHLGNVWAFRPHRAPHHVGSVVAGRCRRLLDAVLSQFKAGKQPKVILEAAATRHPSKSATSSYESEAKNPQFRIATE